MKLKHIQSSNTRTKRTLIWTRARLMHLREQREVELTQDFNFNDAQVRIYQGIKLDKRASLFSEWRDAEPIPEFNFEGLTQRAKKYFHKFL